MNLLKSLIGKQLDLDRIIERDKANDFRVLAANKLEQENAQLRQELANLGLALARSEAHVKSLQDRIDKAVAHKLLEPTVKERAEREKLYQRTYMRAYRAKQRIKHASATHLGETANITDRTC